MLESSLGFIHKILLRKSPALLFNAENNYVPAILHKSLLILTNTTLQKLHEAATGVIVSLLLVLARNNWTGFRLFLDDITLLLQGMYFALASMRSFNDLCRLDACARRVSAAPQ